MGPMEVVVERAGAKKSNKIFGYLDTVGSSFFTFDPAFAAFNPGVANSIRKR
jgi:hypothetical protein